MEFPVKDSTAFARKFIVRLWSEYNVGAYAKRRSRRVKSRDKNRRKARKKKREKKGEKVPKREV